MTQRIRLTLISVCLVALLTGSISIYYLKTDIEKQFQFGLQRADLMKSLAADSVARSLDLHPSIPIPQALLSDSDLADRLRTIMAVSRSLLEITICDNQNRVLLSTDTSRHPGDCIREEVGFTPPRQLRLAAGTLRPCRRPPRGPAPSRPS